MHHIKESCASCYVQFPEFVDASCPWLSLLFIKPQLIELIKKNPHILVVWGMENVWFGASFAQIQLLSL